MPILNFSVLGIFTIASTMYCKDCEYYEKSYSNIDIFTDMKRIQEFKELKEKQEKIEKMGKIISLFDEDK